jgi:hypothetical protein
MIIDISLVNNVLQKTSDIHVHRIKLFRAEM